MSKLNHFPILFIFALFLTLTIGTHMKAQVAHLIWMKDSQTKLEKELIAIFGESQSARVQKGLKQVADFWRAEDGDAAAFEEFVRTNFAGDQTTLDVMFNRFENLLEQLSGHMNEIGLAFRQQSDLELGPIYAFDETFAAYSPGAHITDDFFKNKLAFIVRYIQVFNATEFKSELKASLGVFQSKVFLGRSFNKR